MRHLFVIFVLLLGIGAEAQVEQWRGANRDGVFQDANLLKEWPVDGPELLYTVDDLGKTYSSVVCSDFAVYVTGLKDSMDVMSCLDYSGKKLWEKPFGRGWDQSFPNTRCTPTIEGDRVYVLSGMDLLSCFHAESGDLIWQVDVHKEYASVWDMFGVSESILLVDDKVIVTPGGEETTVVALDKMTGELVWKSESLNSERSNGSPVLYENDTLGIRQIIAMNRTHVLGVDPQNGKICWTYHYNHLSEKGDNATILANSPVFYKDDIYISGGWDHPSAMLEIAADGNSVELKYEDHTLDNQNHGVVRIGEFVYGSNFIGRQFGKWVCMRWENGEVMWIEEWETKGPIIAADGMLYLLDEKKGNIALVKATEKNFELVSSFKIEGGRGPCWARPIISDGKLWVRRGESLMVYGLRR